MALKVRWTKRASASFSKIVEYLEISFGERTAQSFVKRTFSIIENLSEFPAMGTIEVIEKKIRGFVITELNTLFYRYSETEIILLNFFDARQNPKKKQY